MAVLHHRQLPHRREKGTLPTYTFIAPAIAAGA
jgi:hypothetical protein